MSDVAAIRERHFVEPMPDELPRCFYDSQEWPCDVAVLLAATPSAEPPLDLEVPTHDHDSYMHAHGGARHIHRFRPSAEPEETAADKAFEAELAAQQAEDDRIDAWIDQQPEWGEHR